jgi:drug/metabolite transporter (DMT)-like permease
MVDNAASLSLERSGGDSFRLAALAALLFGAIAMGASPIFVRLADIGPFASAFWRVALSLPFLWAWAAVEEHPRLNRNVAPHEPARHAGRLGGGALRSVVLAGLFFAGDLFFWHLAIVNTTVANATFLATMAPVVVILGAWAVLREEVTIGILLGLALCLFGAATLLGSSYALAQERILGDAFGCATAFFFGGYILALRVARRSVGSGRLSFLSTAVTTAVLFVVALALEDRILPLGWQGFLVLLGLALVSQVGGQGLLAFALGHLPAGFSSLVIFIEAVAAAALGWLLLGEALGPLQFLGGFLILAGIYVARPRRRSGAVPG